MYRLNVKKFGFALGLTVSLIYLGCMIVMATAGQEGTIIFFNSLLHGLDTSNIIRMDVPLLEAFLVLCKLHFRLVDWSVYCGIL